MALTLNYQTKAEFAARFWQHVEELHRRAKNNDTVAAVQRDRLVWWVWQRIQDGDFTSAQVRDSFNTHFGRNLDATQWNAYVTNKLVPMKDRYLASTVEGDF